jgi:hypothetical protein
MQFRRLNIFPDRPYARRKKLEYTKNAGWLWYWNIIRKVAWFIIMQTLVLSNSKNIRRARRNRDSQCSIYIGIPNIHICCFRSLCIQSVTMNWNGAQFSLFTMHFWKFWGHQSDFRLPCPSVTNSAQLPALWNTKKKYCDMTTESRNSEIRGEGHW